MRYLLIFVTFLLAVPPLAAQEPVVERIATNLLNPRGIAVLPDGRLLVVEAGTGRLSEDPQGKTGRLSIFDDINDNGIYSAPGEIIPVRQHLPGYNALIHFNPGRDEVVGAGDVVVLDDGRVFYTQDDTFEEIAIVELNASFEPVGNFITRPSSLNALVYDPAHELLYVAESTSNQLSAVTMDGEHRVIAEFPLLANDQQAVPAGLALDPRTGDVLVALFSGQLYDYYGTQLSFMPGDAKIVRVNPATGEQIDEIINLTTAVDVAVDERGNIFVVEMTTRWPPPPIHTQFDLYDPDGPPDDGGYARYSGRVTLFPADGGNPIRLADGLDEPTNITYHAGALYVSTGQGTPGRPIIGPNGRTHITGEIYRITNFLR